MKLNVREFLSPDHANTSHVSYSIDSNDDWADVSFSITEGSSSVWFNVDTSTKDDFKKSIKIIENLISHLEHFRDMAVKEYPDIAKKVAARGL